MERYEKRENEESLDYLMRLSKILKEEKPKDLKWEDIVTYIGETCHGDTLRKAIQPDGFGALSVYEEMLKRNKDERPRLVISDVHLPFAISGWLDFIKSTHAKYNCHEEIIINGDLFDFHALSFHQSEADAMSANDEHNMAKEMVKGLVKSFSRAKMTIGNHDAMISRKAKSLGIDERFVKTLPELFNLPDTWEVAEEFIVDNVYYRHIGSCGGKTGHINSAVHNRMSTVVSHLHGHGGVGFITAPNGEMIFGMNTGALVDDSMYAMRYGRFSKQKSTLGCGLVYSDTQAMFVPFK